MQDKTSYSNSSSNKGSQELKKYTTALIKAVLYDGDEIEEYLPELKRLVFSQGIDYAAYEHSLHRLFDTYNSCQAKNKFSEPNILALKNLCNELNVGFETIRILLLHEENPDSPKPTPKPTPQRKPTWTYWMLGVAAVVVVVVLLVNNVSNRVEQEHLAEQARQQQEQLAQPQADSEAWAAALERNTKAAYEGYLAAYPSGSNTGRAHGKIRELEDAEHRALEERESQQQAEKIEPQNNYKKKTNIENKKVLGQLSEGLRWFKSSNGKYGYLNSSGDTAIMPIFEKVSDFVNKKALVTCNGKTEYINKFGYWINIKCYKDPSSIWHNIYAILPNTNIEDYELILRVLSTYDDPQVLLNELFNFCQVYLVISEYFPYILPTPDREEPLTFTNKTKSYLNR